MNTLFTNETTIENIISSQSFGSEPQRKRSLWLIAAILITVGLAVLLICLLPDPVKIFGGVAISIMIAIAVVQMWTKTPKLKKASSKLSEAGYIRTGNSKLYSYSFTEDEFTVASDETKTVKISDIINVRDIRGAYQIKTADGNFTLKKKGFSDGGVKKFRDLMIYKGISIK